MRPSTAPGSRTRDAILNRAAALASAEGLEGLTIGRLASELEMSKSGLFDHFGSKQGLQLATLERANAVFEREVIQPSSSAEPGLLRLRTLIEDYLQYLERDTFPGGCFLSAVAAEFDGRPGPVRDAVVAASGVWGAELERNARLACDQGELPAGTDPEQIVFELGAFTDRANAVYQLHGDRRAFVHARTAIARLLEPQP
jgi:AcrR family transcriptional regulator